MTIPMKPSITKGSELFRMYVELGHQNVLPISEEIVQQFLNERPLFKTCEDLKYAANILYDYVGSQGLYDEEVVW